MLLSFLPITVYLSVYWYHELMKTEENVIFKKNTVSKSKVFWKTFTLLFINTLINLVNEKLLFQDRLWSFNLINIVIGIIDIDTVQYWTHRMFHTKFFYQFHKVHHELHCPWVCGSLYNSYVEASITGPLVFLSLYLCNLSYVEYCLVTSLAFYFTMREHTFTEKDLSLKTASFHWIHHSYSIKHNFQQPFFHFWDKLMGTYYYQH
jgi:sterol desaturase/sphingolipid hydroxylase (fatty acid hydroxylase superfamily)